MKRLLTLLMVLLLTAACIVPAFAASVEVSLPVTVRISGKAPETPEDVSIVLTARDADSPMPAGAGSGMYALRMRAGSESSFPPIAYSMPGNYHYTIRQEPGTVYGCSYDGTVFEVEVCIAPGDDGLYPVIVIQQEHGTTKLEGVTFLNTYSDVTPTPAPTPYVTVTPVPGVTVTPVPDVTVTPVPDVTVTPVPGVPATPVPGVTVTPVPGVTVTPVPDVTVTPVPGVTVTPAPTPTATPQGSTDLPPTGVEDYWMFYLGGAAAFLLLAAMMLRILLRPEKEGQDE